MILLLTVVAANAPAIPDPVAGDPVFNGDFSLHVPSELSEPLEGTPADECIGIGHQALWGSETWQQRLQDAALAAVDGDTEGALDHAQDGADMWLEDPAHELTFLSGVGHCVSNTADGSDLVWFNAAHTLDRPAVHWSHGDDNTEFGYHFDDEPFERSVRINANASASTHNLWQAYPSPFQAYTGNFDALEFQVKADTLDNIPNGANVIVSFSATPLAEQSPYLLLWLDCDLRFNAGLIRDNADPIEGTRDYQVSIDPTEAEFRNRFDPACEELKADWDAAGADSDERREILGQLRMVQLSFWSFNQGVGPVVLDHVGLPGSSLFLEEAAAGNVNVNPFEL